MKALNSKQRKIENELFFRQANEKVANGFSELQNIAKAENDFEWVQKADEPISFFCECSDENCHKRVKLKPSEYLKLRKNRKQFILYHGHEVPEVERKIKVKPAFEVVEKYVIPNKKVNALKPTNTNNA